MPSSLRSMIKKYKFQGKLTEQETNDLLKKLDNHDKELIKEFVKQFVGHTFEEDGWAWTLSKENVDDLLKEYGIGAE